MTSFADSSEEAALIQQQNSISDTVAQAALTCNKTIVENVIQNCSACTLYCDKQVQYETVVEQYNITTQLAGIFNRLDNSEDVRICKDFLFDEESVVQKSNSRSEDD
jgi:aldehyde:ferredoxin oxidoreductase